MAILKRPNGTYQARLQGSDGKIHSKVFMTKAEAEAQEMKWKLQKRDGVLASPKDRHRTLNDYWDEWFEDVKSETPPEKQTGWRKGQEQLYRDYVKPHIGHCKLMAITPQMVKRVLVEMAKLGKAEQTQRHVFNLLRKMFGDAIENYQYLTYNPAIRKLKPVIPTKEARHLNLKQVKALLQHVEDKKYGLAIWLQIYLGLRIGELQALKWEDIDLQAGRVSIRRMYVRKTESFRDYPKGRKQHVQSIPPELRKKLEAAKATAKGELVVTSPKGNLMPYRWYLHALKGYCEELEMPVISTHGLRHSTSELYMSHGASRDDLRQLFAHSSTAVTDRYIHYRGTNLEKVSNVIRLFGRKRRSTTNRPRQEEEAISSGNRDQQVTELRGE